LRRKKKIGKPRKSHLTKIMRQAGWRRAGLFGADQKRRAKDATKFLFFRRARLNLRGRKWD
jgi:hypothetical protein